MQFTEISGVIPLVNEVSEIPAEPEAVEAEETPVVAEDASDPTPVEAVDAQAEEKAEADKAKKREGYKARAKIARAEKEAQELREQLAALKAERESQGLAEPNRDEFDDYEQYLDKRAEWRAEQLYTRKEAEQAARRADEQRQSREYEADARWNESQASAREKYNDFDSVVYGDVSISQTMANAIRDADDGAEVAYYLAKNVSEADRISQLSDLAQIKAIGAIEERLKERPTRPPPPKPVSRGRTSQTTAPTTLRDDMPLDQWLKVREAQLGRS